jgi:hypothetical protein
VLDANGQPLAAIGYQRDFDVDDLLLRACGELKSFGMRLGGVIQRSSGDRGQCASLVHVVDLRSGESFDIWEARGACARGCRLDERGLLDAEATIRAAISDRMDLLVINRFGRAESLGRGLIGCFVAALEANIRVLTAVRAPYVDSWVNFHGGLAAELPPEVQAVVDWAASGACKRVPRQSLQPLHPF